MATGFIENRGKLTEVWLDYFQCELLRATWNHVLNVCMMHSINTAPEARNRELIFPYEEKT